MISETHMYPRDTPTVQNMGLHQITQARSIPILKGHQDMLVFQHSFMPPFFGAVTGKTVAHKPVTQRLVCFQ